MRIFFQNINGISPEFNDWEYICQQMIRRAVDVAGFAETNRPWTKATKAKFHNATKQIFQQAQHNTADSMIQNGKDVKPWGTC